MGKRKVLHFKSKRAYLKWLAYDHTKVKHHHRKNKPIIYIHGRRHKVNHKR